MCVLNPAAMRTLKHPTPGQSLAHQLIPYAFALVVFCLGFTDLSLDRDEAFPLFCLFILLLLVPKLTSSRTRRPHA